MNGEWLVTNLWHYSLQAAAVVAALAVSLGVFAVRAPKPRLGRLQLALGICLFMLPMLGYYAHRAPASSAQEAVTATSFGVNLVATPKGAAPGVPWTALVAAVYLAGCAARLLWLVVGVRRMRRGRAVPAPDHVEAEAAALQSRLGTRARIEWRTDLDHAVTHGLFPPRVLLPAALVQADADTRRAVLCHELIHVRRGDWGHLLIEEAARTLYWFHPAIRWLVAELHVVREELVDREVVNVLGERRSYLELLYSFADAAHRPAPAASLSFFGRHQIERRIRALLVEAPMSRTHRLVSGAMMTLAIGIAGGAAAHYFPLRLLAAQTSTPSSREESQPGPIERKATTVGSGSEIPARTRNVGFVFPAVARGVLASAVVTVRVVIDESGNVAEARVLRTRYQWRPDVPDASVAAVTAVIGPNTISTIRQWHYESPSRAPLTWTMTVNYHDGSGVIDRALLEEGTTDKPFQSTQDPSSPIRIGGNVRAPRKLVDVLPEYPPDAMANKVEGVVILEAVVDAEGAVSDTRVVQSVPALDAAAIDAVRQWKFTPTLVNGVAVPVIFTTTVNFKLQ